MNSRRRAARVLALGALGLVAGCSNLTEAENGVVSVQLLVPSGDTVAVGTTVQLTARALNRGGETVATTFSWATPDTTVTVDAATGLVTGIIPGIGRVQASSGGLTSPLVTLLVVAAAPPPTSP